MLHTFRRIHLLAAPLAGLLASSACVTTKEEGDLLRRDIRRVQEEQRSQKDAQAEANATLDDRLKAVEERSREVSQKQKELDDRNSRNKADFGAEVATLQQDVAGLRGSLETKEYQLKERELQLGASNTQVAALEARIVALEKKILELDARPVAAAQPAAPVVPAAPPEPEKPKMPSDKQGLYDWSKKKFDDGDYAACRDGFEKFLKTFPKEKDLLDNAHFWTGEAHFAERKYDKAILSYQKVITDFPKSAKADGALYKMGLSFSALGYDDDARVFYDELLQKYPKSALAKEAKNKLAELAKKKPAPKGKR